MIWDSFLRLLSLRNAFFKRRRTRILLLCLILFFVYVYLSVTTTAYSMKWTRGQIFCKRSKEFHQELADHTRTVHSMLKARNLTHFLLYGSLLGVLRYGGFSEWDNDVDFGVFGEEFSPSVIADLKDTAKSKGIFVMDKLTRSGELRFAKYDLNKLSEDLNIVVDVFLFYDQFGTRKRSGIEPWILFPHYNTHEVYPDRFVLPLKTINFEGIVDMTIPNQGEEIVKYLYRFDWWKVVKPPGC